MAVWLGLLAAWLAPRFIEALTVNAAYLWLSRSVARQAPGELATLPELAVQGARGAEITGRAALAAGDARTAIAALGSLESSGRANPVSRFLLAEAYALAGERADAILQWRSAGAMPYFRERGLALRHQKDWAGAEQALLTAAAIAPEDGERVDDLARFYLEWGKAAQAKTFLLRALTLTADPYEQLLTRAELAFIDGRVEDAAALFSSAVEARPAEPEAYVRLAAVLDELKQPAQAAAVLRSGITNAPVSLGLYLRLGLLLSKQAAYAEADDLYATAARVDPRSDEPWLLRAQNALAGEHITEAESYLQQALRLSPRDAETYYWLAILRARSGDCNGARAALAQATALAPDEPAYRAPLPGPSSC